MRLIDADKLYLPPEDIGSRMAVAYAPTVIGECKYCREADFIYQDADFCYCLAHSTMMSADDWCSSFKEEVDK